MPYSLQTFQSIPFEQQVTVVWNEGKYIATRYEEEDTVGLYHMDGGFFVELYYDSYQNKMVERTNSFSDPEGLEDYTPYVKLNDLM
ncbi:hypothetical protein [Hymenobacter sp. APR13]|uniref:hypothetical protein n=1 Tax=Hymenobacter sp. APR13 TaxID=1356852 RepID=UPI0004E06DF4|nr:hypothetical protein [Hymenobacter sp. APR13]AII50378.1 hypothetical protein N008_00060 [Hymenobacter sp. APR13]